MSFSDDELLPLSGLQHLAFCERQWALIHLEQAWADNLDTTRGSFFHERVDAKGYSTLRGFRSERAVHVVSHSLGLYGVADIVEYGVGKNAGIVRPVEYKVGKPKIQDWDRIQVAAQAMCIEEMSRATISSAALFYGGTRRREEIQITNDLRARVESMSARMHRLFEGGLTPKGTYSPRCKRCSLYDFCLPNHCEEVGGYWHDFGISLGESR